MRVAADCDRALAACGPAVWEAGAADYNRADTTRRWSVLEGPATNGDRTTAGGLAALRPAGQDDGEEGNNASRAMLAPGEIMGQADELRKRATRIFALALQASERGDEAFADELADAANMALEQAEKLERGAKLLPPSSTEGSSQHAAQQQQQPKPEPDEE